MTGLWRCFGIVALLVVAACGVPQPTADSSNDSIVDSTPITAGSGEPIGDPPPTEVPQQAAGDCAPPDEPGPADAPPDGSGDLMDFSDYGGGRWRLCLTGPIVASLQNRAMCRWSDDRSSVIEVSGMPTKLGPIDYDAWVAVDRGEFQMSRTDWGRVGSIATYVPRANPPIGDMTDDRRIGRLAFDVTLLVDPESGAPAGAPPRHVGQMRWICADPPPAA